jgi:antitoxin component YwqK of YwqJK toxin-antitoxin module
MLFRPLFLTTIFILNVQFFSFADVINLNSGDKIRGKIIQQNDKYLTIERADETPITLSVHEIASIESSQKVVEEPPQPAFDPFQTNYGIKYDFSPLNYEFDPAPLIQAITNINMQITTDIEGVVVLDTLEKDIARLTRTAQYKKDDLLVEDYKYVLFISPDMARDPEQIIRILKKQKPKTPQQIEKERIEMIRRGEIAQVFDGNEVNNNKVTSQIAKSPGRFIQLVNDMIDGKFKKEHEIEIEDYYLSFSQLFVNQKKSSDDKVSQEIPSQGNFIDKQFYSNNVLAAEHNYVDGVLSGISKEYDENGKLKAELNFDNDQLNGRSIFYDDSGKVFKEIDYKQGLENGLYKEYFKNGLLHIEMKLKDGKRDEYFKEYFETGKLKYEEQYRNGKLNGMSREYYPNGELKFEMNYQNGSLNGLAKDYYETGKLKYSSTYEDDKRIGEFREFYESGVVKYVENYIGGKVEGFVQEFFENGNPKFEFNYSNGVPVGEAKEFYESGKVHFISNYKNSQKNGRVSEFSQDGKLIAEYNYLNDALEGPYKLYDQGGKVKSSGQYQNGQMVANVDESSKL